MGHPTIYMYNNLLQQAYQFFTEKYGTCPLGILSMSPPCLVDIRQMSYAESFVVFFFDLLQSSGIEFMETFTGLQH